jgi:hypothetical protein
VAGLTQAAMYHRQAAALADAADRVGVAESELPAIRLRLLQQRALFADVLIGTDTPIPDLLPTPAEIAAAMPGLGDLSAPAVAAALASVVASLDAADAALGVAPRTSVQPVAQPPVAAGAQPAALPTTAPGPTHQVPHPPPAPVVPPARTGPAAPPAGSPPPASPGSGVNRWRPGARNALVYGGYALTVTVMQAVLFTVVDERTLPLLAPCCLFVMPAFAWAAGWFTVGLAFRGGRDGPKVNRTPRVGALVCLIPDLLLCAGLGVLFVADR